jgi:hypothetical protein
LTETALDTLVKGAELLFDTNELLGLEEEEE